MHMLFYAGLSPWRPQVLQFSAPLVAQVASALTLVVPEGWGARSALQQAAELLQVPAHIPVEQRILARDAQGALLAAAEEQAYDLAILGRLQRPLERLLPGPRSKAIVQRLGPPTLRVQGSIRPVRRMLLASGGSPHTLANARTVARLAAPLGAHITVLHVVSHEQVCFEPVPGADPALDLLDRRLPEARMLHETVGELQAAGISARLHVRRGLVIDEVVDELRTGGYDLLAVGTHRPGNVLDRLLLADIGSALLDYSPVPVLMTRGRQD